MNFSLKGCFIIFCLLMSVQRVDPHTSLDQKVGMVFDIVSSTLNLVSDLFRILSMFISDFKQKFIAFLNPKPIAFSLQTQYFNITTRSVDLKVLSSSDSTALGSQNPGNLTCDLNLRISTVLGRIREQIPRAVIGVEGDILEANRNNLVLFFSNFLGGLYGVLTARSVDIYTGGHVLQAIAQALYGYGYSTPFGFELVSPQVNCGPKDFEAARAQYSFLDNHDLTQDKKMLTYYCTLFNLEIKRRLYCLNLKTSSNSDVTVLNAQVDLYTSLLAEKFS